VWGNSDKRFKVPVALQNCIKILLLITSKFLYVLTSTATDNMTDRLKTMFQLLFKKQSAILGTEEYKTLNLKGVRSRKPSKMSDNVEGVQVNQAL
jgi:hypothetical protein